MSIAAGKACVTFSNNDSRLFEDYKKSRKKSTKLFVLLRRKN